jgi:hypothetical protein
MIPVHCDPRTAALRAFRGEAISVACIRYQVSDSHHWARRMVPSRPALAARIKDRNFR